LRILDFSAFDQSPKILDTLSNIGQPISIYRNYLLTVISLTEGNALLDELNIWDISDPLNPKRVYQDNSLGYINDIEFVNNLAYLAGGGHVTILDISNPSQPQKLSRYSLPLAERIAVHGEYAYITHRDGVTVLDVSNIKKPKLVAISAELEQVYDVAVWNGYIYTANDGGLYIFKEQKR